MTENAETTVSVETGSPVKETQPVTEEMILDWGEPSQVLSGDWNEDGQEDTLEAYQREIEGSIYVTGLQLRIGDQLYHDDVLQYYEIPYEEENMTVSLSDAIRYYHRFDENHMIRVDETEMYFETEDKEKSGYYYICLEGDRVACIMWDPYQ